MDKRKKAGIVMSVILGLSALLYLGGILGQGTANYRAWLGGDAYSHTDWCGSGSVCTCFLCQ